ncbi:hypothetical protein EC957_003757 [Mortierella hygrophila]|uniref:Uncharacterized protein n=1 Tax=Mortierella hygrophila TaxID=979708 RepID=A0A9P6F287_9FUNG|nr:hypothetical protein EC957_003757 [Mortierella hygrophila]
MIFLTLLLLILMVVFAPPTKRDNQEIKSAGVPGCFSSTLKWAARTTTYPRDGKTVREDIFGLLINNGYYGLIPKHPSKPNTTLRSTDKRFTIKHSEAGANQTLTLEYLDQMFMLREYNEATVRLKLNTVVQIEYDYWVCI